MKWRDCTFAEAIRFSKEREIRAHRPSNLDSDYDSIGFTDGTAIAVRSVFMENVGTETTPEFEETLPKWMIYD